MMAVAAPREDIPVIPGQTSIPSSDQPREAIPETATCVYCDAKATLKEEIRRPISKGGVAGHTGKQLYACAEHHTKVAELAWSKIPLTKPFASARESYGLRYAQEED